jgi:hypothetical protein
MSIHLPEGDFTPGSGVEGCGQGCGAILVGVPIFLCFGYIGILSIVALCGKIFGFQPDLPERFITRAQFNDPRYTDTIVLCAIVFGVPLVIVIFLFLFWIVGVIRR